jgi:hypothetical protein
MLSKMHLTLIVAVACTVALAEENPASPKDTPASKQDGPGSRGLFFAYGGVNGKDADGKLLENEYGVIWTSADGEHWEPVFKGGMMKENQSHGANNGVTGLARGKGRYVAVGSKGIGAMYSEDGRKWTHATKLGDGVTCAPGGFAFGNDMFVIANVVEFIVSADGTGWERRPTHKEIEKRHGVGVWDPKGPGHVRGLVFGNGVFVLWGERRLGTSKDARTFLHHEVLPGTQGVMFGGGRFIALNTTTGHKTSTDGVVWKPLAIDGDDQEVLKHQNSGVWTGEEFVVSGKGCSYHSKDGESWTKTVVKKGSPSLKSANRGLLIGSLYPTGFTRSRNGGENWEKTPSDFGVYRIQWFDEK